MPPKTKFAKRRRPKKKTTMDGKLVQKLKRMPYPDSKNFEGVVTFPASAVSGSLLLNTMFQGIAENQRIGTDVNLSYLTINMYYEDARVLGSPPIAFHWAIVYCPNQVATTAYNQVFFNDTIEAVRNIPNIRRYKVLKKGYVNLSPQYLPTKTIPIRLPLGNRKTRYNVVAPAASADFDIGVLFLLIRSTITVAGVNTFINWRVGYTDS